MKRPRLWSGLSRRLQWRLTLSYTLVTVAALVVVELALLGLLLVLLNSDVIAREIVAAAKEEFVPRTQTFLEQRPPDVEGLGSWLQTVVETRTTNGGGRRISQGLSIQFDQDYQLFVVDGDRRLLAQAMAGHSARPLGETLDVSGMPELALLLSAALAENRTTDVEEPYATTPEGALLMALPVGGRAGKLLGAFVLTMPLPTFNLETFRSLGLVVLISVIPFTLAAGLVGTIFGSLTARGLTGRIRALSRTADGWSRGDFSAMSKDSSADELGQLGRRLNRMAEQLQNLLQSHEELASVRERNRLARELHDSVKQQVFATTMQVGAAQVLLPDDVSAALRHLAEAEKLSRQSQEELALLIQELRPAALDENGLGTALSSYVADWSRQTGIDAELNLRYERHVSPSTDQALFRVAQEALANVARHSEATKAEVAVQIESGQVILSVVDNGRGFEPQSVKNTGYGLESMRERVESLGGRVQIESALGEGTAVRAWVPADVEKG